MLFQKFPFCDIVQHIPPLLEYIWESIDRIIVQKTVFKFENITGYLDSQDLRKTRTVLDYDILDLFPNILFQLNHPIFKIKKSNKIRYILLSVSLIHHLVISNYKGHHSIGLLFLFFIFESPICIFLSKLDWNFSLPIFFLPLNRECE